MIILIAVVIGVIFSIVLGIVFKDKEKVDKGFAFVYYKLSYRRKFIRTIVTLPIFIACLVFIYYMNSIAYLWSEQTIIIMIVLLIIAYLIQLLYNYRMWKKEEENQ